MPKNIIFKNEGGYMSIQATKPQTLAYALSDSPVGLVAWIIEKFRAWSDCSGDLSKSFSKDELLANIMIYWITNTAGSAAHIYYENMHSLPPMEYSCTNRNGPFPWRYIVATQRMG